MDNTKGQRRPLYFVKLDIIRFSKNDQITLKIGVQALIDPLIEPCKFQINWTSSFCVAIL